MICVTGIGSGDGDNQTGSLIHLQMTTTTEGMT